MLGHVLVAVFLSMAWGVVAVPVLVFGGRWARRVPERASRRAVPLALAVGAWTGPFLGLAGLIWGADTQSEAAGEIAALLFVFCSVVGGGLATLAAWRFVVRRRSPEAGTPLRDDVQRSTPAAEVRSPGESERFALRLRRAALGLLIVGVLTSLAGLGFSLSVGMISLAFAMYLVRPLALCFVGLHFALAAFSYRAESRMTGQEAPARARAATMINLTGLVLAAAIALGGPAFFEEVLHRATRALVR